MQMFHSQFLLCFRNKNRLRIINLLIPSHRVSLGVGSVSSNVSMGYLCSRSFMCIQRFPNFYAIHTPWSITCVWYTPYFYFYTKTLVCRFENWLSKYEFLRKTIIFYWIRFQILDPRLFLFFVTFLLPIVC